MGEGCEADGERMDLARRIWRTVHDPCARNVELRIRFYTVLQQVQLVRMGFESQGARQSFGVSARIQACSDDRTVYRSQRSMFPGYDVVRKG
jgi:hypothetical protein